MIGTQARRVLSGEIDARVLGKWQFTTMFWSGVFKYHSRKTLNHLPMGAPPTSQPDITNCGSMLPFAALLLANQARKV